MANDHELLMTTIDAIAAIGKQILNEANRLRALPVDAAGDLVECMLLNQWQTLESLCNIADERELDGLDEESINDLLLKLQSRFPQVASGEVTPDWAACVPAEGFRCRKCHGQALHRVGNNREWGCQKCNGFTYSIAMHFEETPL